MLVKKRNSTEVDFNKDKIITAVTKAMKGAGTRVSKTLADEVATSVMEHFQDYVTPIDVDLIHTKVEDTLMDFGLHSLAREYITYRFTHKPSVFRARKNLKPYEYPQLLEYVDAIRHSYWLHSEFNYNSDIQDMKVNMSESEVEIVKRAMLAISQIEVAVKTFWGKVGDKLPKPEIQAVGATFAESEVRHADAYSNLIEVMGLNEEFKTVMEVPAIKKRIEYLEESINVPAEDKDYFHNIILFSMFIENVSLFSQFLIIMSFNKHRNILKGISNAVEATSKEEDIHARFGFDIVNIIKEEHSEYWTKETEKTVKSLTRQAFKAESAIIDWIYGDYDLEFQTKDSIKEYIKDRFNRSLNAIGMDNVYEIDESILDTTEWFDDEVVGTKHGDFFVKRSINYSKRTQSVTEDDLF